MDQALSTLSLVLVEAHLLDAPSAQHYEINAQNFGQPLLRYLSTKTSVCPQAIAQCLAKHYGLPLIDLSYQEADALPLSLINPSIVEQYRVLPIRLDNNQLYLATDDPSLYKSLHELQFLIGHRLRLMVANSKELNRILDMITPKNQQSALTNKAEGQSILSMAPQELSDDKAPIVQLVDHFLRQAVALQASDLHFESYDDVYRVRYRKDGILHELAQPPLALAPRIAARLKIMANLDIAEQRIPQDGRFSIKDTQNNSIDCRFSSCPTLNAEKITLRILNHSKQIITLNDLGLTEGNQSCFIKALNRCQGLILVTGPTGSGKTVTLYAALHHLNSLEKNISTVEDPIEIKQLGINQVPINPKIGFGFAQALRALLRQDPDIIMIGEIRDQETAQMALNAAQTGHLVLSTLHANSAPETIIRLQQLGLPKYLIAESLSLVIAQRLIRRLCKRCKRPDKDGRKGYRAVGCALCHQGYQGRMAIFELMPISQDLRHLILTTSAHTEQINQHASASGMLNLYQAGFNQVQLGETSHAEIQALA